MGSLFFSVEPPKIPYFLHNSFFLRFREKSSQIKIFFRKVFFMFCLDHFSLHCIIKMLNFKVNLGFRHWYSDTNVYLRAQSLYFIYESFQGKIIHAENDWIFIIVIKFKIIGVDIADGQQWLPANSRRIIADDCLADRQRLLYTLIPRLTE